MCVSGLNMIRISTPERSSLINAHLPSARACTHAHTRTRTHTHTEPSDVSPDSYPSSDGGSFQLTKAEVEGVREEKKKTRKYRGATEEVLEGIFMKKCFINLMI